MKRFSLLLIGFMSLALSGCGGYGQYASEKCNGMQKEIKRTNGEQEMTMLVLNEASCEWVPESFLFNRGWTQNLLPEHRAVSCNKEGEEPVACFKNKNIGITAQGCVPGNTAKQCFSKEKLPGCHQRLACVIIVILDTAVAVFTGIKMSE